MSSVMKVKLSNQAAPQQWGKNALLSNDGNSMIIHLPQADANQRMAVQRAARRLQAQGIIQVALNCSDLNVELEWAFAKGFSVARGAAVLKWATTDKTELQLLDARVASRDWAVKRMNGTP